MKNSAETFKDLFPRQMANQLFFAGYHLIATFLEEGSKFLTAYLQRIF